MLEWVKKNVDHEISTGKNVKKTGQNQHVSILGAGPAGLTAAYCLQKSERVQTQTFESDSQVGGLSKTVQYKGYSFDIGGHRFFTRSAEVQALWHEILPDDFISVTRSSKIYYNEQFLSYPLNAFECVQKLPLKKIVQFLLSYANQQTQSSATPINYEEWMIKNFGIALYKEFFKSYTEKVWGMECSQISADWAAQRINKLNIKEVLVNSFGSKAKSKSLIGEFIYPKLGPGQVWDECARKVINLGGTISLSSKVSGLSYESGHWQVVTNQGQKLSTDAIFFSLPLGLLPKLSPGLLPSNVEKSLSTLRYRHFVTVALMGVETKEIPTQWFYIQDEKLKLGRVQNYKYWSKHMVPASDKVCLGLEFFCSEDDGFWEMSDEQWVNLAKEELAQLNLFPNLDWIEESAVIKVERAYPIYNENYQLKVAEAQAALSNIKTFYPIGRNGMHRYNNQDHAMMTALISAQNFLGNDIIRNPWNVNQDAQYIED